MNGKGTGFLTGTFALVLLALLGGYMVLRTYTPPASATPVVPEVRQFSLVMHSVPAGEESTMHHWMPAVVAAQAGDSIIIKVTNADPENAHGFSLGAFNLAVPSIPPGRSVTLRFRASRAGIFNFQCTLAGCANDHPEQTGQLIVLGP